MTVVPATPPRRAETESDRSPESRAPRPAASSRWERPRFEVISLDCEITAYAPAGDEPLF